jgi:hypothetical protein
MSATLSPAMRTMLAALNGADFATVRVASRSALSTARALVARGELAGWTYSGSKITIWRTDSARKAAIRSTCPSRTDAEFDALWLDQYATDEERAELGARYVCGTCGVDHTDSDAADWGCPCGGYCAWKAPAPLAEREGAQRAETYAADLVGDTREAVRVALLADARARKLGQVADGLHPAVLFVWSANGCTPITKRTGGYCDELVITVERFATPEAARERVRELIRTTPHGHYGAYYLPTYPNQNTRNGWTHAY